MTWQVARLEELEHEAVEKGVPLPPGLQHDGDESGDEGGEEHEGADRGDEFGTR
jgi:hypothetical protein